MKNLTLFPMSSYKSKVTGLVITALSLVLMLVVKIFAAIPFITHAGIHKQFFFFFVAALFGMYMIAFSKEKNDDERVQKIRAKSCQGAFMLLTSIMIAVSICAVFSRHPMILGGRTLSMFPAIGLGVYLFFFHWGLYFDPSWNYNDDTVFPNIRKNKTFFIIYFSAAIIVAAIVFLLRR